MKQGLALLSDKTALLWGTLSLTSPTQGTLSEKLPSSRFSQVPAGSDYPCSEAVLSESKVKSLLHTLFSLLYRKGKDKAIPAILPVAIDFPLVGSGDFLGDG